MICSDFLNLSARIGSDPLLVQGPGGNTSVKENGRMWIKASGTVLADAVAKDIFVEVDVHRAMAELDGAGDGSCRSALADPSCALRPSIETTFHAMFPQRYVFHFHSVNTIAHAIAVQGREQLQKKLAPLNWVTAPYRKPGIPLSLAIRQAVQDQTAIDDVEVVVLENHGVIVAGEELTRVDSLIGEVESRLQLPITHAAASVPEAGTGKDLREGWQCVRNVDALAEHQLVHERAVSGTYYPDHVVFLGPGLPVLNERAFCETAESELEFSVAVVRGHGVMIRDSASSAHRAMLQCVHDVLVRVPQDWQLIPIGQDAEAELLNWDAEQYRQQLARRKEINDDSC